MHLRTILYLALSCATYLLIVYQLIGLAYSSAPFLQKIPTNIFVGVCITIGATLVSLVNNYVVKADGVLLGVLLGVSGVIYMLWPEPSRAFNHLLPMINLALFAIVPIVICMLLGKK